MLWGDFALPHPARAKVEEEPEDLVRGRLRGAPKATGLSSSPVRGERHAPQLPRGAEHGRSSSFRSVSAAPPHLAYVLLDLLLRPHRPPPR
eukprot:846728-Pyramimonas_sp.AAC.1